MKAAPQRRLLAARPGPGVWCAGWRVGGLRERGEIASGFLADSVLGPVFGGRGRWEPMQRNGLDSPLVGASEGEAGCR